MSDEVHERLARELDERKLPRMAAKARTGYYGDFSTPIAFPKLTLCKELAVWGEHDLIRRVQEGEFDG